jgi:hypothetical protein
MSYISRSGADSDRSEANINQSTMCITRNSDCGISLWHELHINILNHQLIFLSLTKFAMNTNSLQAQSIIDINDPEFITIPKSQTSETRRVILDKANTTQMQQTREEFEQHVAGIIQQMREEKPEMEMDYHFKNAIRCFEEKSDKHPFVFLTGKAGTGKSTLIQSWIKATKRNVAVVAPTGLAALNVGGQTIHSFFKFPFGILAERMAVNVEEFGLERLAIFNKYQYDQSRRDIYKSLDCLVIDEISMVRIDVISAIETVLRLHGPKPGLPFGGVKIIAVGDLFQLPPVVPYKDKTVFKELIPHMTGYYFIQAKIFRNKQVPVHTIELQKLFRQNDQNTINLLNQIRVGYNTLNNAN